MSEPYAFSVIVPTFSRAIHLERCVNALFALDFPVDRFEIIIVDDAASDATAAQVARLRDSHAVSVKYVSHARGGPAKARNAGARVATGKYLAFTDDDCQPLSGWLHGFEASLASHDKALVGGLTLNALPDRLCSRASQLLIDYLYLYYRLRESGSRFFTTNNLACARSAFWSAGGFDESFPLAAGEDREFCERFQRLGGLPIFAPLAEVLHWHDLNLRRFARQHFNYGRGADFLHLSRMAVATDPGTSRRPRVEGPSFYVNLVRYPLTVERGQTAMRLASLMCLSQAAYITGYAFQRASRTLRK